MDRCGTPQSSEITLLARSLSPGVFKVHAFHNMYEHLTPPLKRLGNIYVSEQCAPMKNMTGSPNADKPISKFPPPMTAPKMIRRSLKSEAQKRERIFAAAAALPNKL